MFYYVGLTDEKRVKNYCGYYFMIKKQISHPLTPAPHLQEIVDSPSHCSNPENHQDCLLEVNCSIFGTCCLLIYLSII